MIDADVDTAVIGDTGTGAQAVLFVADLAIDLAVSKMGHAVLGRIGSYKISLLQELLLFCRACGNQSGRQRQLVLAEVWIAARPSPGRVGPLLREIWWPWC